MFTPQLYIEGKRCDLYGDETIQVTDSIKNLREPDQFFSAYTEQFSLPASPINNNIFSHYYNADIVNGFDARVRHDAELRVNGIPYRKGQIKLNEVEIKHGKPSSYAIVFYGNTSKIKQELAGSSLRDLSSLSVLNHDYTGDNVKAGFELGLYDNAGTISAATTPAQADIVYPFISHTSQYIIDGSVAGDIYAFNPEDETDTTTNLQYTDLKPAIRLNTIIDAIESDILSRFGESGVTFDRTGFFGLTQFQNLWMWCHREKGGLIGEGNITTEFFMNDMTWNGAGDDVRIDGKFAIWGIKLPFGFAYATGPSTFTYTMTITGSGLYDVRVDNEYNGKVLYEERGRSGSGSFSFEVDKTDNWFVVPNLTVTSAGTITNIDVSLNFNGNTPYDWDAVNPVAGSFISIPSNMPDMTCLDFLTAIFKMFNLTIERRGDVYYVETLDDFYGGGSTRDLTNYIDDSGYKVIPPVPFDEIRLRFSEPDTFLIDKRRELVGEIYGDESYDTGSIFEDNDYEIEVGFEKILFERMTDVNDDSLETNMWAWCADSSEDPYIGDPIVFHYSVQIPSNPLTTIITWEHDGSTSNRQAMCSNTVDDGTDWTLTFGSELGEYTQQPQSRDLFTEFWQNYITGVYDIKARSIRVKAWLPPSFIINYTLKDTLIYRNKAYYINELNLNLLTGEAELELITKWL